MSIVQDAQVQGQAKAKGLDLKTQVLNALEDKRYNWRTIRGLARALRVDKEAIAKVLSDLTDEIVQATAEDGRLLFTTRNHYEKTHGFGARLLSALADKVVA